MTVIAWDGKTLAADSRVTSENGNITTDAHTKIYELTAFYGDDELLAVGVAGCCADFTVVVACLLNNTLDTLKHEATALFIGRNAIYEVEMGSKRAVKYDKKIKIAIGSGAESAQTALHLGHNAIEAVQIAIQRNVYCGGAVRVFRENKKKIGTVVDTKV